MNFYTLTFKRKILLSFLIIFLNLLILDIGLYFVIKLKSTETTFIDDKFSKIRHFNLNKTENKEIVFLGSSRTFYHISTNIFKKNNLDIYNFGISGAKLEDYPALVPYIKKKKVKNVIISIKIDALYQKLNISKSPTFNEISYYYDINKYKFFQSIYNWLVSQHLFLRHSEPIFYKIKSFYSNFNNNQSTIHASIDYSQLADCKIFDIKKLSSTENSLKCTNGDGILIGEHLLPQNIQKERLETLNQESLRYLQKLIHSLQDKNTKVILILEPMLNNHYSYSIKEIEETFKKAKIIDLTNLEIPTEFWFDNTHLNYKGREFYSLYLSNKLKKEIK